MLYMRFVLRDKKVLFQRRELPVVARFFTPVVALGRFGEYLDEQRWVPKRVDLLVFKYRLLAGNDDIGIGV